MKEWYHYVFQLSFGILIFQNVFILFSVLFESIGISDPYLFDIIGFTILALTTLIYFILSKNKFGIMSAISLITWIVVRLFTQFSLISSLDFSNISNNEELVNHISSNIYQVSLLLLISGLGLFMYAIFMQMSARKSIPLLLLYVFTNLIAVLMIAWPFVLSTSDSLESQIEASTLGFVLKLILVPILGVITFSTMLFQTQEIFPSFEGLNN